MSLDQVAVSHALVYTDRRGKIVYANLSFVQMSSYDHSAQPLLGQMLHDVIGIESTQVAALLHEPEFRSQAVIFEITIDGVPVHCLGDAAYDVEENFIGWNFRFRVGPEFNLETDAGQPTVIQAGPDDFQKLYTVEQITAIQTMLARLIGFGVRDRLEQAVNTLAESHGWPVTMNQGEFRVDERFRENYIYAPLLAAAVRYAVDITGWKKVRAEMERVEAGLNADALGVASQAGLRSLIPSR
jgi:PAS domain-containing protein